MTQSEILCHLLGAFGVPSPELLVRQQRLWRVPTPNSGTRIPLAPPSSPSMLTVTHSLVVPQELELRDSLSDKGVVLFGSDKASQLASSYG